MYSVQYISPYMTYLPSPIQSYLYLLTWRELCIRYNIYPHTRHTYRPQRLTADWGARELWARDWGVSCELKRRDEATKLHSTSLLDCAVCEASTKPGISSDIQHSLSLWAVFVVIFHSYNVSWCGLWLFSKPQVMLFADYKRRYIFTNAAAQNMASSDLLLTEV